MVVGEGGGKWQSNFHYWNKWKKTQMVVIQINLCNNFVPFDQYHPKSPNPQPLVTTISLSVSTGSAFLGSIWIPHIRDKIQH